MKLLNLGLLALLLGSGADIASAGTITGTIKGPDGAPFRAAFVRVQNVKSKMTMMVLSDSQGRYWTDNLDPGTYDVWATAVGYKGDPARRGNVTVDDKRQTIDFTMQTSLIQWSQLTKYQAGVLLPDAPGKWELVQQCFNCHALGKIGAVGRHDHEGWMNAIDVMRRLGGCPDQSKRGRTGRRLSRGCLRPGFHHSALAGANAGLCEGKAGPQWLQR